MCSAAACDLFLLGFLSWYLKTGAVNSRAGTAALFWGARQGVRTAAFNLRGVSLEGVGRTVLMVL